MGYLSRTEGKQKTLEQLKRTAFIVLCWDKSLRSLYSSGLLNFCASDFPTISNSLLHSIDALFCLGIQERLHKVENLSR